MIKNKKVYKIVNFVDEAGIKHSSARKTEIKEIEGWIKKKMTMGLKSLRNSDSAIVFVKR